MDFQLGTFQMTGGRPCDGWSISTGSFTVDTGTVHTYSCSCITVQAGGSKSIPPAQWFNTLCGSAEVGNQTLFTRPTELGFAFSGQLASGGTQYTIALGQASEGGNN